MATITPPPARTRSLGEYRERVRSPLGRLRGYIRTYVAVEGALLFLLFLALWFWIDLALDCGFFKLFGVDWVQEPWPWAFRLVVLVGAAGLILTVVSINIFGRLFRDFSDASLALVLERRFPDLLGDRLITAVELSDLRQAEAQGYSPAMVVETIHEAAERVEQVPVQKAFDWGRLIRRGALVAALTLGLYLLVGAMFLVIDVATRVHAGRTGFSRFNETGAIWFERDILLQNTIWPRRAQIVFVTFAEPEARFPNHDPKIPALRVRAMQYAIADSKAKEGWRSLTWADLQNRPNLRVGDIPEQPFALTARDPNSGLTVDEVALQLNKFDVRHVADAGAHWQLADAKAPGGRRPLLWADLAADKLNSFNPPALPADWKPADPTVGLTVDEVETAVSAAGKNRPEAAVDAEVLLSRLKHMADLHDFFDRLNARCAKPDMSRTMRRLDLPDVVYLKCTGDKTYLRNELHKGQDNEYSGTFGDLKESVYYTVQADDYWTPRHAITLVPPPTLLHLDVDEAQPAYLYYRPTDATPLAFLHGKKQPFEKHDVLQAGSETSRIDVPAGTDLVLTAQSDKPLREAVLKAPKMEELRIRIDPARIQVEGDMVKFFGVEAQVKVAPGADGATTVRSAKPGDGVARLPLEMLPGNKSFRVEMPAVRADTAFDFEFTDTDGVKGKRKVVIKPQEDTAPELTEVKIETIRNDTTKSKEGQEARFYLVTPKARIPMTAKVHDDHALGQVSVRYNVKALSGQTSKGPEAAPAGEDKTYNPPLFGQLVREAHDEMPLQTVMERLGQPQKPPFRKLVKDFDFKADTADRVQIDPLECDFPLWQEGINLDDNHPFYRMDLWLEAADSDADDLANPDGSPKPHLSKSKETFAFLIVKENYLLEKIGEDEVKQYANLNKRFGELTRFTVDYDKRMKLLADPDDAGAGKDDKSDEKCPVTKALESINKPDATVKDLTGPSVRADQLNELLENMRATTTEVYTNYLRIVREEQLNVLSKETIDRAETKIVLPLAEILQENGSFQTALDANGKFRKALDDKGMSDRDRIDASRKAGDALRAKLDKLIEELNTVRKVMQGLDSLESVKKRAELIRDGVDLEKKYADDLQHYLEDKFFDTPGKP